MTCKTHPDAPHGFDRNASHSQDRYVCECESWEPPEQTKPMGVSCGKTGLQPDSIHTCTPRALVLADALTTLTGTQKDKHTTAKQAADELRRLHAENEALRGMSFDTKRDMETETLLRQALYVIEAWERGCDESDYWRDRDDAIAALRERLGETK